MNEEVSTFPRNKGSDGTHGTKFEYETTLLAYLKCVVEHEEWKGTNNSGVKSFFVANNVQGVGAFDDIVVRKENVRDGETKTKLTFTQCKHVVGKESNPSKGGNYVSKKEIQKYFDSFIEVYNIFIQDDVCLQDNQCLGQQNEISKRLDLKKLFNCQFSNCEFSFVTNIESFPKEYFKRVSYDAENFENGPNKYRLRTEKCLEFLLCNEFSENRADLIDRFCNKFRTFSIPDRQTNLEIENTLNNLCEKETSKIKHNTLRETLTEEIKLMFESSNLLNEKTDTLINIKHFLFLKKLTETKIATYNKITPSSLTDHATEFCYKYQTQNETEFHRLAQLRIYRSFYFMNSNHLCIIVENKIDYIKWMYARSTFKYRYETKIYIFFENYDLPPMVDLNNEQFINVLHKPLNQRSSTVFQQLYKDELNILENSKILFQGYEISLKELCSNLSEVIDEATVCDILESKQLVVGTALPEEPNIYIERKLRIKVLTDEIRKILASFVMTGQKEQHYKFLLLSRKERNADQMFEKRDDKTINSCIYMESIDKVKKKIPEILKKNAFNHYLCTHLNGNLKLQFLTGSESKNFENEIVDEKFLIDGSNSEKIIILSDVAGMGKSTSMLKLAVEYKRNNKSSWVHYIQLGKYSNDFEKANSLQSSAVNFLASKILKLGCIDLKLFSNACNKAGNVTLFLDGFDELSSKARIVFPELILALEDTVISKIFVSCRQSMVRDLEELFLQNAIGFCELGFDEKVNCLLEIWKRNLAETDDSINNEDLQKIAERIIKDTESERNSIKEILAIPLQIKMFAGAYFEEMLECFKHNAVFNLQFDITHLYKNFIHFHVIHYHSKSIADWNEWHQEKRKKYIREKLKGVPEFVCSLIVPHLVESNANDMKYNIENLRDDLGLITDESQTPPLFLHKTIAEYLAADYIVKQFLAQENDINLEQKFESVLTEDAYDILRKFIDSLLDENNFPSYFHKCNTEMERWRREYTAFHAAAWEGNVTLMKALLNRDESCINQKYKWGRTALHLACYENRTEVVKFLLFRGLLLTNRDDTGHTALHVAAVYSNTEILDLLLSSEPSLLYIRNVMGGTPLHSACYYNNLANVESLLNSGCSVILRDDNGDTAFHVAAYEGHTDIMNLLLSREPSLLNLRGQYEWTPLQIACWYNKPASVAFLLNLNCSAIDSDLDGKTALHRAAIEGHIPVMKLLLQNCKSTINIRDNHGVTPLQDAVIYAKIDAITFLLHQGSSVNNRDNDGDTVFNQATLGNKVEAMELLLQYNRSLLNEANDKGETPLHQACSYGNVEAVTFLLTNKDCSTTFYNLEGFTSFHEAVKNGHIRILEMFLQYDHSFLSTRTRDHESPFEIACMEDKTDAFSVLKTVDFSINFRDNICNLIIFYAAWKEQIETKDLTLKLEKYCVPCVETFLYLTCSEGIIDFKGVSKYLINQNQLCALTYILNYMKITS